MSFEIKSEDEINDLVNGLAQKEVVKKNEKSEDIKLLININTTENTVRQPISILVINFMNGQSGNLSVFQDSNPDELAFDFCKNNNLDFAAMKTIIGQIKLVQKNNNNNKTMRSLSQHNLKNDTIKYSKKLLSTEQLAYRNYNEGILNNKYMNYGEYLYERGIKQKEETNKKIETLKMNIQKIEDEDLTFHPQIIKNKSFNNLQKTATCLSNNSNIDDNSKHQSNINTNKHLPFCKKRNMTTIKQVIFNSKKKNSPLSSETVSHMKSEDKNCIKNANLNEYTFHPSINKYYKVNTTFQERLIKSNNIRMKKCSSELNNLKQKKNNNTNTFKDKEYDQELFKPKLISKNNSGINSTNVFQINYNYANFYKRNREQLIMDDYMKIKTAGVVPCNNTTKILNDKKVKAFKYIFNLLDSDEDGIISSISLCTKNLSKNILNILFPIINQIKLYKNKVDEKEFSEAMEVLYSSLTINEKNIILNAKK